MIVCLKPRKEEVHIISWSTFAGTHYTLCGKTFTSKNHVETFSSNDLFPGMCPRCYLLEQENIEYIRQDLRVHKHEYTILDVNLSLYKTARRGGHGYDELDVRYWPKARRMRRKFPAKENTKKSFRRRSFAKYSKATFAKHK